MPSTPYSWNASRLVTAKLIRIYLWVTILALFSTTLISQFLLYQGARSTAHENLRTHAAALAGNLESAVAFDDATFATQTLSALQHYPEMLMATVILPDGKILARYGADTHTALQQLLVNGGFMNASQHGVVETIESSGAAGTRLILVASLQNLNREMLRISVLRLLLSAVIVFASYEVFKRMCRRVTHPIEDLTALMRAVERNGVQGLRAQVVCDDEIGELAKGFNAMLANLEMHSARLITELDERKFVQEKLDRLAHYDPVTHLPNRHYFSERLKMALVQSRLLDEPMALMFVDLDNFKRVNDTFGHHVGDLLLHTVAERLSRSLRAGDIVCRLGGDEFAIIVEHLPDAQQLTQIANKLIANFTQPLHLEGSDLVITGSIGIAVYPEDADNAETLLRFADVAMYAAKTNGKNSWRRFDPEMASQTTLRLTLENQMRESLKQGHFEVVYQPQVDMAKGKVSGFEALARWKHPELGYISPTQFIPVAEECGLIRPLGEWVLRTACQQIVAWNQAGYKQLTVAVNVSPQELEHSGFANKVLNIIKETGCPPAQLELEITESVLMKNVDIICAMLTKLRAHGICIAIDDFGTGYSSMAQLKNLPITKLKIDKCFVDNISNTTIDQAFVTAMSTLAHNLQIRVIAEGVESEQQVQFLRQSGCHNFQGYYFARPLPARQVTELMATKQQHGAVKEIGADEMGFTDLAGMASANAGSAW